MQGDFRSCSRKCYQAESGNTHCQLWLPQHLVGCHAAAQCRLPRPCCEEISLSTNSNTKRTCASNYLFAFPPFPLTAAQVRTMPLSEIRRKDQPVYATGTCFLRCILSAVTRSEAGLLHLRFCCCRLPIFSCVWLACFLIRGCCYTSPQPCRHSYVPLD